MRVIQTLWTTKKNLLEDSFGWINPETALMSWALSANCLKAHCKELVLYTDSEGARILVDKLQLPYTEVIVCYDDLYCPPVHWAYAKMLTYSKQSTPFVHVDGDLYLPQGLPSRFGKSELIAQNEEMGSSYYKNMVNRIMESLPLLPDYLSAELAKPNIGSYNAGVLGGCDIDFIQHYCDEAFRIIKDNGWNNPECIHPNMNHNLLFEQMLFYALVHKEGKTVDTFIEDVLGDNKYTYDLTCNMMRFDSREFLHLLGGYKRNRCVCNLMRKMLVGKCPESYMRVLRLFGQDNPRLSGWKDGMNRTEMTIRECVAEYHDHLNGLRYKWKKIDNNDLLKVERNTTDFMRFLNADNKTKVHTILRCHPYMSVYSFPPSWPEEAGKFLKESIDNISAYRYTDIAVIPTLRGEGYQETLINDLQFNILSLLETEGLTYHALLKRTEESFSEEIRQKADMQLYIDNELEQLFFKGLIYTLDE